MKNCLLVLLMMFSMNAIAEVNKWVDENNQIHYSDQPPPVSAKARKLRSASDAGDSAETGTAASAPAAPKTIAEREAELRMSRQAKKEAANKAAQEKAKEDAKKDYCDQAQKSLKALQEGTRIMEIDANGERSYLEDEQRQQRIAKAQQDIGKYCK